MKQIDVESFLVEKKRQLSERVRAIDLDFKSGRSADSGEQAVELENDAVLSGIQQEAKVELAQVEQALVRLKRGEYGLCEQCGEAISSARLEALPYTNECIQCAK